MSTPPSLQQSSRSSTGALSQQPTLAATFSSTQSSSPNAASSPQSTPNTTPGYATPNPGAYDRAVAKRQPASSSVGPSTTNGNVPATGNPPAQGGTPSSTPTVPPLPTKSSSSKIANAIRQFKSRLRGDELIITQNTTVDDLRRDMRRVQAEQEGRRDLRNMRRIQGCIEAMDQFGKVIEVFLNVSDAVAYVWGPMKFLLLVRILLYSKDVRLTFGDR